MRTFILSQLRFRRGRVVALGLGILVASSSFTLLTAAVQTSALDVRGEVGRGFRPAYDILVRPADSFSLLERERGLVSNNYLSGIFGGITFQQWQTILHLPGIEAAAPIANLGYVLPFGSVNIPINRYLTTDAVQLYRIRLTWEANGASRYPGQTLYVYYTRRHRFVVRHRIPVEVVPGRGLVGVCDGFRHGDQRSPFASGDAASSLQCFSSKSSGLVARYFWPYPPGFVGSVTDFTLPVLLTAVDPVQESRLVGLDRAVVAGRYLSEQERAQKVAAPPGYGEVVPVLASSRTYIDESLQAEVERLRPPPGTDVLDTIAGPLDLHLGQEGKNPHRPYRFLTTLPGRVVGHKSFGAGEMHRGLLEQLSVPTSPLLIDGLWTTGPVQYRQAQDRVEALPTQNSLSVWRSPSYSSGYYPAPPGNQDVQFRSLTNHPSPFQGVAGSFFGTGLRIVGRFDPEMLPGFSSLSEVPLESYYPPVAHPADAATRSSLGGRPLLPTTNLGGYVAQPPFMITTLEAAKVFTNPNFFEGTSPKAPISVIRVRVAGVTGPDSLSLARIRQVASSIRQRTGLAVDITAGSSPTPMLVQLPAGRFGQPRLTVREGWVKKGVAVLILEALDRKSLALFVLILVVTALFLVNASLASVRARRAEIGTLLSLGWSTRHVFRAVLGELALIGFGAGVMGTATAVLLVEALDLKMPLARTLVVAPVAMLLAAIAGLLPAWRASRGTPLDAVRPAIAERALGLPIRRLVSMAVANLRRVPGRTLLAAGGLLVGVAALALLLSITIAFQGVLIGTALGAVISVQVRGVDYLAASLAVFLGAFSVADVLFMNLRERAPEFVTLRATGWREAHLARLVAAEGVGIGLLGSTIGATAGVALSALVGAFSGRVILAGVVAALAGTGLTLGASLAPASLISRMSPPTVLAEE
jgi:putative ABC transport system permease protein